jgi:Flp pilus assembly protein TadG
MNAFLKDFYRDERGAMAAIIVLMLFVLLGFGALAIDMGFASSTRTELQVTASSAAMAGVQSINEADPTDSEYREAAVEFTYRNMPGAGNGNLVEAACGIYDPVGGTVSGSTECSDVKVGNWAPATIPGDRGTFTAWDDDPNLPLDAVRVRAHRSDTNGNPLNLFLAPVVGLAQQDVNVSAVAWAETTDLTACLIAMEPTEEKAFHAQGTAQIAASECGICVNSTSPDGLYLNGTPLVDIATDHGISVNSDDWEGKGSYTIPEEGIDIANPIGSQPCTDPFAADYPFEDFYTGPTCSSTEQLHLTSADLIDGAFRIPSGTHCGGIKIAADGPVVFESGVHHIKDGTLDFVGNHDMTGDGITFVCDNCTLDFRGGQNIEFTAGAAGEGPDGTDSPYLVYEKYPPEGDYDGDAYTPPPYPDETHFFHGDADADYEGIIYVPYRDTEWTGNNVAGLDPPDCFAVIANSFFFSGTSDIQVNASGCGGALDQIVVDYRLVD